MRAEPREVMSSGSTEDGAVVILDDDDIDSILANLPPGPVATIKNLEGDPYDCMMGDIVQVLSASSGFQGTLAYVCAVTDTGRITVTIPANHQIRSYKAKNIRFVCREQDGFGIKFHRQHNTLRWQHLVVDEENDSQGEGLLDDFQGGATTPLSSTLQNSSKPSEGYWIDTVVGTVCSMM